MLVMAPYACKLLWLAVSFSLALPESWLTTENSSTASVCVCEDLPYVAVEEVESHVFDKCVLLAVPPLSGETHSVLSGLAEVFKNDSGVLIGHLRGDGSNIHWKVAPSGTELLLAFYAREKRERSCLLLPPKKDFAAEPYSGPFLLETLVQFVNEKCGTFRTPTGGLTEEGLMHQHIMHNLYRPSEPVEKCVRLRLVPSKLDFFRDFALRSRPVVIENIARSWPAVKKWTPSYLRERYGDRTVHVKLTPDGVFEGVESAKMWSDYTNDWIPDLVKSQLPYPDLVVVRPATSEINFSDFLDFISSGNQTFSAYLEYSSIPHYMPTLQQDMFELPFIRDELELRHLNMWLSDGNTLGKLHFDPFDNLLCQVRLLCPHIYTHSHCGVLYLCCMYIHTYDNMEGPKYCALIEL